MSDAVSGGWELELKIPPKMLPFWTQQKRHKIARGGRGSAKSWSVAGMLVTKGVYRRQRWLCCREIQKSIKESSHKLLANRIEDLRLTQVYDIQRDTIKGPHGTEFLFAGLQDHTADSIKSYEDLDGAWVEEAHTVSSRSANILIPTVRGSMASRAAGEMSELWWTYNPTDGDDYIHKIAENPDEDTLVVDINWRDNPWFPAELELERVRMRRTSEDLYQHIWEGKLRSAAGLIFKRHWFKFYSSLPQHLSNYLSTDYAGGPDPDNPEADPDFTEHGAWGLDHVGDLYATDWWYGQEDPEKYITAAIAMIKRRKPLKWFEEKGVILRSIDGAIRKRLLENKDARGNPDPIYVLRESLASAGSKSDRALGFAARAAARTVWLPAKAAWGERLLNQLCAFTGEDGKKDDAVDVCSLIARGLDQMHNAQNPKLPKRKSWKDELLEMSGKGRRNPATA